MTRNAPRLLLALFFFSIVLAGSAYTYPFWPVTVDKFANNLEISDVVVVSKASASSEGVVHEIERVVFVREGVEPPVIGLTLEFGEEATSNKQQSRQLLLLSKQETSYRIVQSFSGTNSELADYIVERQALVCVDESACVSFFWKHLEHKNPIIGFDSFNRLTNMPFSSIQANASMFSKTKLKRWLTSKNVKARHKDFYAFLLGLHRKCSRRQ